MNALVALSYADRRALVNALRALRRRPWRALMWLFWVALIGAFAWLRTAGGGSLRANASPWQTALQDFWVCGFAAAFGIVLATGATRFAGFFNSRAEALVLVRAPLAPPLVAAYLQARTIATTLAQTFARFAYVIVVGIPLHVTPLGLLRELALLAAATVALTSVILPRALARGAARAACIAAGCAIVLAAALPLVRDALLVVVRTPAALALARRLPNWHPGLVFNRVAAGDAAPVAGALLLALLCGTIFVAAARDAYPELYASALANLEWRARFTARRTRGKDETSSKRTRAASARAALRGAAAFVWLDALTWSRRVPPALSAVVAVLALAAGVGLALFARGTDAASATWTMLGVLVNVLIALSSTSGIRLATELRRPLFWLGEAALFERLAAWTYAPVWRDAIVFALAALGYGVLAHDPRGAALLVAVALAMAVLTRAIGVAIFALLPNALDQRGPAVFLRLVVAYTLIVPPAVGVALVWFLSHSPLAGGLAGLALIGAESGVLIGFAAWRLAGRVDALAAA